MLNNFFINHSARTVHAKEIYNLIRKCNKIAKTDLQDAARLPRTTLDRTIGDLLSMGLIEETGMGESCGGRPPVLYRIKSDAYYLVGIELSRTVIKVALTDLSLKIINQSCLEITGDTNPSDLLDEVADYIKNIISFKRIGEDRILGIGVGAVGPLDKMNGVIKDSKGFINDQWNDFPIKQFLQKKLRLPVVVNNGVNAAVLAEYWHNAGKSFKSILYVLLGVGLRYGMIADGELISDKANNEDAYGHIIVEPSGRKCYCGNQGCIESYASIPGMIESYKNLISGKTSSQKKRKSKEIYWENVCEAVNSREENGMKVVSDTAYYLGIGLANIINILNPELVIIGGNAIHACEPLYAATVLAAKEKISKFHPNIVFSRGVFNEDAVVVGSAALIMDYHLGKETV